MLKKTWLIFLSSTFLFSAQISFANLSYQILHWPEDDRAHMNDPKVKTECWYYVGKLTAKLNQQTKHFVYYISLRYMRDVAGNIPTLDVQLIDIDDKKIYGNSLQLDDAINIYEKLDISAKNFKLTGNHRKYNLTLNIPTTEAPISFDLTLTPKKPPLLSGSNSKQRGLVSMENNTNGFYYSIPRLQTEGFVQIGNDRFAIDADTSLTRSWMDHQWGDFSVQRLLKISPLAWMTIQLNDGTDININEFVNHPDDQVIYAHANISKPNGKAEYTPAKIFPGSKLDDGYPTKYTVYVYSQAYHLNSVIPNQNNNPISMGIMSLKNKDVREPNASFAIIENSNQQQE